MSINSTVSDLMGLGLAPALATYVATKGSRVVSELLYESATDNITAKAGGGQSLATPLTTELNKVTVVATAGDSVMLPASAAGLTVLIENAAANPCQVYGAGTDTINNVATATGVSQMSGSVVLYTCYAAGTWYANGLGTGYAGSFETQSYKDAMTARVGGGQGVLFVTTMISRFTTVGSAGDSVTLPTSVPGMSITIANATATSMNVFPDTGGTINGGSVNAAFALAGGKSATFYTTVALAWHAVLSA